MQGRVAVTGAGSRTAHGIIRAFRASELRPFLLGLDATPKAAGLYHCDAQGLLPPAVQEEAWLEALERVLEAHQIQLLVPGCDPELPLLARHRARLEATGCKVLISSPAFVALTRDKLAAYERLAPQGVPYVRTLRPDDGLRDPTLFCSPMVLKPRDGSGSRGLGLVERVEDLPRDLAPEDWILQDFLRPIQWREGTSALRENGAFRQDDEINLQGMVAPDGTVVSVFTSRNKQVQGVTQEVRPLDDPALESLAWDTFQVLSSEGLRGPCNLQGRMTCEGFLAYEINPRFTGNAAARTTLGYPECRMAQGLFVEAWTPEQARACIGIQRDKACLRYWDEVLVPQSALDV